MNSYKKSAIFAGILILLGMVAGILSIVPAVESTDYLSEVYPKRNQVLIGAVFQFLLIPIYLGFSLILYQVVKKYKENLAIGFVGFRIISSVFQLIGVILIPIFVLLSEQYLNSQSPDIFYFETLGSLLKSGRDLSNHLGVMLATGLGNLILYFIFYKTKLIPKWLTIWGIFGNTLAILSSFLILFDTIAVISTSFAIMTLPLVFQEIVLAIWLIRKGFNLQHFTR